MREFDLHPSNGQTEFEVKEIYDDETGVLRIRQTRLNDKLHSPPNGEPSHVSFDPEGRPLTFIWHEMDREHRDHGPSEQTFSPESGIAKIETFMMHGRPRPPQLGPNIIYRNPKTGAITGTEDADAWYEFHGIKPPSVDR